MPQRLLCAPEEHEQRGLRPVSAAMQDRSVHRRGRTNTSSTRRYQRSRAPGCVTGLRNLSCRGLTSRVRAGGGGRCAGWPSILKVLCFTPMIPHGRAVSRHLRTGQRSRGSLERLTRTGAAQVNTRRRRSRCLLCIRGLSADHDQAAQNAAIKELWKGTASYTLDALHRQKHGRAHRRPGGDALIQLKGQSARLLAGVQREQVRRRPAHDEHHSATWAGATASSSAMRRWPLSPAAAWSPGTITSSAPGRGHYPHHRDLRPRPQDLRPPRRAARPVSVYPQDGAEESPRPSAATGPSKTGSITSGDTAPLAEDACCIRCNPGVLCRLRHLALNLLPANGRPTCAQVARHAASFGSATTERCWSEQGTGRDEPKCWKSARTGPSTPERKYQKHPGRYDTERIFLQSHFPENRSVDRSF